MIRTILLVFATVFGLTACETLDDLPFFGDDEREIPVSEVPKAVMASAQRAVEGFEVAAAAMETEDGQQVYELEGTASGRRYEIEVSADGQLLEVDSK